MTLVVTVAGRESIWMLADRRLSFGGKKPPKDDARKIMFLETDDGVAIIGYAGLGATFLGTEPSDWMSRVLRGRRHSMEESISVLAKVANEQLPQHLSLMPRENLPSHHIIIIAFVDGKVMRYSINLTLTPDRRNHVFSVERNMGSTSTSSTVVHRFSIAGSGGSFLRNNVPMLRRLLPAIRAHEHRKVSPHAVSDYLANLSYEVHQKNEKHLGKDDKTVGPSCIVAWRYKKGGLYYNGGGAHKFYTGTERDRDTPALPSIGCGMDISALAEITAPISIELFERLRSGESNSELDTDKLDTEVASLKTKPDEKLS